MAVLNKYLPDFVIDLFFGFFSDTWIWLGPLCVLQ